MAGTSEQAPPRQPSDEAKSQQLKLATEQGRAFQKAVEEMTEREAHGREVRSGDYLVGVAVEEAEGLYRWMGGRLQWEEPSNENAHIEVVVRDAADGRFIPQLMVHVTVLDAEGQHLGTERHPFLWHPWLYHYGRNWRLPGTGEYTIRVHVEAPSFARHDRINGRRFEEPTEVEFSNVQIDTGRKK